MDIKKYDYLTNILVWLVGSLVSSAAVAVPLLFWHYVHALTVQTIEKQNKTGVSERQIDGT